MTKDELNEILKKDDLCLGICDGVDVDDFTVRKKFNGGCKVIAFDEYGFFSYGIFSFSAKTLQALVDYANTPIEKRKPKPQLFNIIIAKENRQISYLSYIVWKKCVNHEFEVDNVTEQRNLNYAEYQFTQDEIDILKSKLPDNEKQIVDLGVTPVVEQDKETKNDSRRSEGRI